MIKIFKQLVSTKGRSLRVRAIRGGVYVLFGEAYTNALRLAGNLIMTRLLFPEAFGLMLIVNLVILGINMLSDVGVRSAFITKQGEISKTFIDTGWTIMVIRGFILAVGVLLIAHPVATYYEQEQLFGLIVLSAVNPIIQGFTSPHPILAEKGVLLGRVVLWRTLAATAAMLITIVWLFIAPSVQVLVYMSIMNIAFTAVSSHYLFPGVRPSLKLDKEAFAEIFKFGRWVVISTALTFLGVQGDSLVVSTWLNAEQLGVFSIAVALYKLVSNIGGRLSQSLLLPVYSEMRESPAENFNKRLHKLRLVLLLGMFSLVMFFAIFGGELIQILYDPRYHGAGAMLEIMAVGALFYAVGSPISVIPLAFGDSYRHMWMSLIQVASLMTSMILGAILFDFVGLLYGIVIAQLIFYVCLRLGVKKYVSVGWVQDLVFLVPALALIGVVWYVFGWPVLVA